MEISVIIPVYNAGEYIKTAVESALKQEETSEIILIEDGSPDHSLEICKKISKKYNNVRLLQHPDKKNHGAGASRNLGVLNAKAEYIAFLDADDYYLENRFESAKRVFNENSDADGVYDAIGVHLEDEASEIKWNRYSKSQLTTVKRNVSPNRLFFALFERRFGTFTLDGLVVKKEIFRKSGLFLEKLRLHQDTAMIIQMAAYCNLYAGELNKPLAVRRVHRRNRFLNEKNLNKTKLIFWRELFQYLLNRKLCTIKLQFVFMQYVNYFIRNFRSAGIGQTINLLVIFSCHPILSVKSILKLYKSLNKNEENVFS